MKNLFRSLLAAILVGLSGFSPVHAAALTDVYENSVIDWLMRGQALTPPATGYIALFTTCPTDSASGTEVSTSGTGYARASYAATLANWAGTQGYNTTVASTGSGGLTSNNNAITFAQATSDWGTVNCVGYMSAITSGTLLWYTALTTPRNITNGSTAAFAGPSGGNGALTFQIDN